jgi:hypothetical protein
MGTKRKQKPDKEKQKSGIIGQKEIKSIRIELKSSF